MEVHSIETIVRALNDAKVKYLIVGGVAVVAQGTSGSPKTWTWSSAWNGKISSVDFGH
jgi:hypothetical protein